MKNKTGMISGIVIGFVGFLFMFKIIILDHVSPEGELAPGIVVLAAIFNGLLFAYVGYRIQNSFGMKRSQA